MAIPQDLNLRWSLDFVMDTLVSGRRFRILTVVDDFTRECLDLVVDTSLTGPGSFGSSIASSRPEAAPA
jgi:putative transposase